MGVRFKLPAGLPKSMSSVFQANKGLDLKIAVILLPRQSIS